jgi:uncharacterized protein YcfL
MKKYILILTILSLFLFVGCNNQNTDNNEQVNQPQNNMDVESKENNAEVENKNEEDINSNKEKTMKYCFTQSNDEPVLHTYYISDESIYEKADTKETGFTEKITTKTQSCVRISDVTNPDLEWNCVDGSVSNFNSHKDAAEQMTSDMMASVMNIKCETINYDESKFIIE